MAFKTLQTKREPITLEAHLARLERRRAGLGEVDVTPNSGKRRTPSKCVLLEAIAKTGAKW